MIQHRREDGAEITTRVLREGPLAFDPPDLEIEIGEIFEGL